MMTGITLLCVVLGLIAAFPQTASNVAWELMPWAAALGVLVWALVNSRQRPATLLIVGGGILVGSLAMPAAGSGLYPLTGIERLLDDMARGVPVTIAAGLAAGLDRLIQGVESEGKC